MSRAKRIVLVLGGARSGKSRHAEALAESVTGKRIYIATAKAGDDEMAARIAAHRERRGEGWTTIEEEYDLPGAIRKACAPENFVLADCLTLWLSALVLAERECEAAIEELASALGKAQGTIVLVSNEVGLGIVPENPLARRFRDLAGQMNQRMAECADEVVLVTAGLPLLLKPAR